MPNYQGNPGNSGGKKGRSGRRGAFVERNSAEILHEMFFTPQSREEIQAKLKSGKYSLKDLFVSKGYSGNDRVLLAIFNKNFPDDRLAAERWMTEAATSIGAIKSPEDVMTLIEETIKEVRAGSMTVQAAANIGRLASIALKAIETGEIDRKTDLLNSVIRERTAKTKKRR